MPRPLPVAMALWAVACTTNLDVPEGVNIRCQAASECPAGLFCHVESQSCLPPGEVPAAPLRPALVFVSPGDGDDEVMVDATIILVFSLDIAEESLAGRVELASSSGGETPSTLSSPGVANTFTLVPEQSLQPLTEYRLRVAAGVRGVAEDTAESTESYEIRFVTAAGIPAVVWFLVDRRAVSETAVRWLPPTAARFSGVILARSSGEAVSGVPEYGQTYPPSGSLGNGQIVISGAGYSWSDDAGGPTVSYSIWAHDDAFGYSQPVASLGIAQESLRVCADGRLRFSVEGLASGSHALHVSATQGGFDETNILGSWTEAGQEGSTPVPGLSAGTFYYRHLAVDGASNYRGLEQSVTILPLPGGFEASSSGSLTEPVEMSLPLGGWSEFAAEVDTDPATGAESWEALPTPVHQGERAVARYQFLVPGRYRLRMRVVDAACGTETPWHTSDELTVSTADYWVEAGSSGLEQAQPSLEAALAVAGPGDLIAVHGGEHTSSTGTFSLPAGVTVRGGYANDYVTWDDSAHETVLRAKVELGSADSTVATRLQYVTIHRAVAEGPDEPLVRLSATGGTIRLENSTIHGLVFVAGDDVRLEHLQIPTDGFGIVAETQGSVEVRHVSITGPGGMEIYDNTNESSYFIEDVRFESQDAFNGSYAYGLAWSGSGSLTVRRARLSANGPALGIYGDGTVLITDSAMSSAATSGVDSYQALGDRLLQGNLIVGSGSDVALVDDSQYDIVSIVLNNVIAHRDGGRCVADGYLQALSFYDNWFVGCSDDPAAHNARDGAAGSSGTLRAADNVQSSETLAQLYTDWDGGDDDPRTWADNDLSVATTTEAFVHGGHDPRAEDCGTVEVPASCGGMDTDLLGATRTCEAASACVTVGPVERD